MIDIKYIEIESPVIRLDQFLKWAGIVSTGGQAKEIINDGLVKVNGKIETHRSHNLVPGDEVEVKGVCLKLRKASTD
ncbi:MAG: hypothetical protein PWP31_1090 [Clostridia bacterium]|nr:hypothetical protein [Clostridia bacterium]